MPTGNVKSKYNFEILFSIFRCFVARISSQRIQRDILMRRTWESDPLLHYESTVLQVRKRIAIINWQVMIIIQVRRRSNIYKSRKSTEDEDLSDDND